MTIQENDHQPPPAELSFTPTRPGVMARHDGHKKGSGACKRKVIVQRENREEAPKE